MVEFLTDQWIVNRFPLTDSVWMNSISLGAFVSSQRSKGIIESIPTTIFELTNSNPMTPIIVRNSLLFGLFSEKIFSSTLESIFGEGNITSCVNSLFPFCEKSPSASSGVLIPISSRASLP